MCIAAIFFAVSVLAVLLFSPEPSWGWRVGAGVAALTLAWAPARTVLFGRGNGAVRRIEWTPTGVWRISDRAGQIHEAQLSPASATLGPWLLLIWKALGGRRFHALIDCAATDPAAFRALKGRLNC